MVAELVTLRAKATVSDETQRTQAPQKLSPESTLEEREILITNDSSIHFPTGEEETDETRRATDDSHAHACANCSGAAGDTDAEEDVSMAGNNRDSAQQTTGDDQAQTTLKWAERRGGTRALVEKTREAFLLQMAIDTRKAGSYV